MNQFSPTANLTDFDTIPNLREAWSRYINDLFDDMIYGPVRGGASALQELQKWGFSDADIRFYNPLSMPIPPGSKEDNVTWRALPTSLDDLIPNTEERLRYLDEQHISQGVRTRVQDEYCEWVVFRNAAGQITKVVFTSEPAAYYEFLADDPYQVGKKDTQKLLVDLYQQISGDTSIKLKDLLSSDGRLNSYNPWNAKYCIHMQQENNTLGAELNIAARSSLLRRDAAGGLKTDAADLIACGEYGAPSRQSDPTIGSAVNAAVRNNQFVTLQDPVGLYMTGINTKGFKTPDGTSAQSFWTPLRGKSDTKPGRSTIVRAEFAVPEGKGYTVSDIKIGGEQITHGAQLAEFIGMRLGVLASPASTLPMPRAIGCWRENPTIPLASRPSVRGGSRA